MKYLKALLSVVGLVVLLCGLAHAGEIAHRPNHNTLPSRIGQNRKRPTVKLVRESLAEFLNVNPREIRVKSVERVVWGDSSLGFPEPGESYLPATAPGYNITLTCGGEDYEYHTDMSGGFMLDPDIGAEVSSQCTRELLGETTQEMSAASSDAGIPDYYPDGPPNIDMPPMPDFIPDPPSEELLARFHLILEKQARSAEVIKAADRSGELVRMRDPIGPQNGQR
ncbi:hypothetical protein ACFL3J_02455 [Candidatus Omnitrophota bacterium]